MKICLPKIFLTVLVVLIAPALYGLSSDFDFRISAKMVDSATKKASGEAKMGTDMYGQPHLNVGGGTNRTKEDWVYDVTIENKTFHDLAGLEVKYTIFFKQEKQGSKAEPIQQHQNGTFQIPAIRAHDKQAFTTDSVELKKSNLVGAYHYTNGGRIKAEDMLVGMAIRIYQNGQQLAEWANPSGLLQMKAD
jgi:hypothetical protein